MAGSPNTPHDPVIETAAQMIELSDQIFEKAHVSGGEGESVDWTDPITNQRYSLRSGFMGDVVILESPDGNWDNGSTYKAGATGLTIGTNEAVPAGMSLQDRFKPVIEAMRKKLESKT